MQKKIFALWSAAFLCSLPLAAATLTSRTAPETDGCLIDTDNDGIVDKVTAVKTDGEAREAISGKLWKQAHDLPLRPVTDQPLFYLAILAVILGVQLFLAGFLGELINRGSSDRNKYLIDKTLD